MSWDDGESYRRDLPHRRRSGATYFVTWCLHRQQPFLGMAERGLVFGIIRYYHGQRFHLHAVVVMDDHVHVLVRTLSGYSLDRLQHSWKSFSANQLQRRHGRKGRIWQTEAWDRIVRDESERRRTQRYFEVNPASRWPGIGTCPWLWLANSGDSDGNGRGSPSPPAFDPS